MQNSDRLVRSVSRDNEGGEGQEDDGGGWDMLDPKQRASELVAEKNT